MEKRKRRYYRKYGRKQVHFTRRTEASLLLNPETPPFLAVSIKFLASKHFLKSLSLSAEARLAPSFPHHPLFLSILNLFSFRQFPIASGSCP